MVSIPCLDHVGPVGPGPYNRMTGTKINKQKVDVSHGYYFRYSTEYLLFIIPKSINILIVTMLQKI